LGPENSGLNNSSPTNFTLSPPAGPAKRTTTTTTTKKTETLDPQWPANTTGKGCSSPVWRGSTSQRDPVRVLVIGDSLTRESRSLLEPALARKGWNPVVRCWGGKGSAWGVEQVKRARALKNLPRTVVVALGTNDIWWLGVSMETAVDNIMSALGPKRKVYWVNLWFGPNGYGLSAPTSANLVLKNKEKQYSNLVVIDFATKYARAIKNNPKNGWADGVHLNSTGYRTRTKIIVRSLGRPLKSALSNSLERVKDAADIVDYSSIERRNSFESR